MTASGGTPSPSSPAPILETLPGLSPGAASERASRDGLPQGGRHFAQLSLRWRVFLSQLPLAISVLLVFVFVLVVPRPGDDGPADTPAFFAGVAGVLLLTVAATVVPWNRLPLLAYWSIPLLDFITIAAIWDSARHVLDGMTMLSAFPVFWLAWSGVYPVWGISLGFIGSAMVTWWPYFLDREVLPPEDLLRPVLVPVFMLAMAIAASVLARSMDRQRDELQGVVRSIRQQNRRLETVLDTTDVGIVVTDRDGNGLIMNSAQRRQHLIGQPEGMQDAPERDLLVFEADGRTPVPEVDRPVYRAVHGESFAGRLYALGVDGSQQFLTVSAQAMTDDDGEFDGTVVVFQNVTDLIDAIRSREKFVADVSHEFRTPLTSIIGFLDLAIEDEQDEEISRYLRTCQRNAERLLTLVNTLLDSASSNSAVAPEPTDLARLVRHSVESAQIRANHAEITLVSELPENLPLQADKVKISQVADNLISNAIKYTQAGGTVTVTVRQAGECAELEVADNGFGLTPEEQEKLFTNFYRTEHVRRAAIPGTGLGLAITRAYVRAHGGEISVSSEKDVGSTFTVSIPVDGPPPEPAKDEDTVHAAS
ncbi:MAG: PAS domain-containing sensor histidine kinase [Micrococcus sp.]|nr:PAS domain-containing sensor histidine kinase [Micrococcus sp.]